MLSQVALASGGQPQGAAEPNGAFEELEEEERDEDDDELMASESSRNEIEPGGGIGFAGDGFAGADDSEADDDELME